MIHGIGVEGMHHLCKYQIEMNEEEFQQFRSYIYTHIGINLSAGKKALLVGRLSGRLRTLHIPTFLQYLQYVKQHKEEREYMFNAVTTNVTKFFREDHHFTYLEEVFLPQFEKVVETYNRKKELRIWCAACSTGEEPYTAAMVVDQYFKRKQGWSYKILASDINTEVLETAKEGIYLLKEAKDMPYQLLKTYFMLGKNENAGLVKVKNQLKAAIQYEQINLNKEGEYPASFRPHLVFCRNVFIYFDRLTRVEMTRRFHQLLPRGGLLFLGHSESIALSDETLGSWKSVHQTVYEKR